MKTIRKKKQRDPRSIHESLQKGYGIEHPERVIGYAGFFFDLGDIRVSDRVDMMMHNPAFRKFVETSLKAFENNDYGLVSTWDDDCNTEEKWLWGGGNLFGRYAYGEKKVYNGREMPEEYIKIRYYEGNTYVLFDSEMDCIIHSES